MKKKDWGKIMTQASFMVKSSSYKGIWVFQDDFKILIKLQKKKNLTVASASVRLILATTLVCNAKMTTEIFQPLRNIESLCCKHTDNNYLFTKFKG